jgi:AraC-like DNA-binding protein
MSAQSDYREYKPPAHLADYVECFWTHGPRSGSARVVPDTCVDIVFSRDAGLQIVGSMTRPLFVADNPNRLFGARLRAGAVLSILRLPVRGMRDQVVPFGGREMHEPDAFRVLERVLAPARSLSPVQLAIGHLAVNGGLVRLDDTARMSGLSLRQFRRHCIEQTGLSPKTLARIGRFRRAWEESLRAHRAGWAALALECAYYDQAHLVSDFVEFSGVTPAAFRAAHET